MNPPWGPGSVSVEFTGAKKRAISFLDLISEWDVVDWCCVPRKGWEEKEKKKKKMDWEKRVRCSWELNEDI